MLYVKEIYVMLHLWNNDHTQRHDLKYKVHQILYSYIPIAEYAKNSPFPIYFFSDDIDRKSFEYYKLQRSEKGLNGDQFLKYLHNLLQSSEYKDVEREPEHQRSSEGFYTKQTVKQLGILIDLMDHPEKYNGIEYYTLDKDTQYVLDYVMCYQRDLENHFSADVHNLRWEHPAILKLLAASMHKNKCKTFKSYLELLKSYNWQIVHDRENKTNILRHNKTEIRQESTSTTDGDQPDIDQKYQTM